MMWSTLLPDVVRLIASTLSLRHIFRLLTVDRRTRIILSSPSFWILLVRKYFTADEHVLNAIRNDVGKLRQAQRDLYRFMNCKFSSENFAEHGYREFLLKRHPAGSYSSDLFALIRGAIRGNQAKIITTYLPRLTVNDRAQLVYYAAKRGNLPLCIQLAPSFHSSYNHIYARRAVYKAVCYTSLGNDHERILDLLGNYVEQPYYDYHVLLGALKTGNRYMFEKTRQCLNNHSYLDQMLPLNTALKHGNYKMAVEIYDVSVVRDYLCEMHATRFSTAGLERLVMEVDVNLCYQAVMNIVLMKEDDRLRDILIARDTEEERVKALYQAASCGDMCNVDYLMKRVPSKYYENVFVKGACHLTILNRFERYVKLSSAYEDALHIVLNKNALIADVEGILSRLLPHIYEEDCIDLVKATKRLIAKNYYTDSVRQQKLEMCRLIQAY